MIMSNAKGLFQRISRPAAVAHPARRLRCTNQNIITADCSPVCFQMIQQRRTLSSLLCGSDSAIRRYQQRAPEPLKSTFFWSLRSFSTATIENNHSSNDSSSRHDYAHDISSSFSSNAGLLDKDSTIQLKTIHQLIAKRLVARKAGSFHEADQIRDELRKNFGVTINDNEKTWRQQSTSNNRRRRPSLDDSKVHHHRSPQDSNHHNNSKRTPHDLNNRHNTNSNKHGKGDEYRPSIDAGESTSRLSASEISHLLAKRLKCKKSRNFQDADTLLQTLEENGVYVNDDAREWRADGVAYPRPYRQSKFSNASNNDASKIQTLVNQRNMARRNKDFAKADSILVELQNQFQVQIHDHLQQWSIVGRDGTGNNNRNKNNNNTSANSSRHPNNNDNSSRRMSNSHGDSSSHRKRGFVPRDETRPTNDDGTEKSSRDSKVSSASTSSTTTTPRSVVTMTRRGSGPLNKETETTIVQLVQERINARREDQFELADRIRDRLRDEFRVRLDDRGSVWILVDDSYSQKSSQNDSNGQVVVEQEDEAAIVRRIGDRVIAKMKKEYEHADTIRDELFRDYSVIISDTEKQWWIGSASNADDSPAI